MEGLLLEILPKEVENLFELTLQLILVILESFGHIVVLVNVDVKDIIPRMNPWSAEKKELVSSLVDKAFIADGGTQTACIDFFIWVCR